MIKKLILTLIIIHLSLPTAQAVCPVNTTMPLKTIETLVKEHFETPFADYVRFSHTATGFMISIKDELLFDECGCLTDTGKTLLNIMAQVMKISGRRWTILCHSDEGEKQVDRISRSSLRAGAITNYLTDQEKCLINQLFPIGFGSIMPNLNLDDKTALTNRIDFLIEDYNLRVD